jgi:hypothetical protein
MTNNIMPTYLYANWFNLLKNLILILENAFYLNNPNLTTYFHLVN